MGARIPHASPFREPAQMILSPKLVWAIAPSLAAWVGYLLPVFVLELFGDRIVGPSTQLLYPSEKVRPIAPVSRKTQLIKGFSILFGPVNALSVLWNIFVFGNFIGHGPDITWFSFIRDFLLLNIIGDFGLYWGHRIQHEVPYLWKNIHTFHHSIHTPSPVTTLYIHPLDAFLQGSLPFIVAAIVVQPNPFVFSSYIAFRVMENVLNHSGADSLWLNVLCLKVLPLRCRVSHHDHHHKYSSYGSGAKNYGEQFWVWDWMFGTLARPLSRCDAAASGKEQKAT
eukprot:c1955_g1_i2.p1 GENE.c1955_g1_i2~~c1955_g1_i2.p1  ORF type:complete len:282 (+),score=53.50 c1955_g1_i2:3-848(+)